MKDGNDSKGIAGWVYGAMALAVAIAAGVDAAEGATKQDDVLRAQIESAPGAEADGGVQRSAEGYMRDREPNTLHDVMTFRETRSVRRDAAPAPKPASESGTKAIAGASGLRSIQYGDHWVYDAGTDLLLDADLDGYYRYLRVHFDVDSYFDQAYVYARLYTSPDGESWDFYYETDDFLVTGSTPDDAYEVESELLANYPPAMYDVLVEIYDADTNVLVDEFGPLESSAFSVLPLEDADFDGVTSAPVVVVSDGDGGGGSFSWIALLALAGAAGARLRPEKKSPARAGRFRGTVR